MLVLLIGLFPQIWFLSWVRGSVSQTFSRFYNIFFLQQMSNRLICIIIKILYKIDPKKLYFEQLLKNHPTLPSCSCQLPTDNLMNDSNQSRRRQQLHGSFTSQAWSSGHETFLKLTNLFT